MCYVCTCLLRFYPVIPPKSSGWQTWFFLSPLYPQREESELPVEDNPVSFIAEYGLELRSLQSDSHILTTTPHWICISNSGPKAKQMNKEQCTNGTLAAVLCSSFENLQYITTLWYITGCHRFVIPNIKTHREYYFSEICNCN